MRTTLLPGDLEGFVRALSTLCDQLQVKGSTIDEHNARHALLTDAVQSPLFFRASGHVFGALAAAILCYKQSVADFRALLSAALAKWIAKLQPHHPNTEICQPFVTTGGLQPLIDAVEMLPADPTLVAQACQVLAAVIRSPKRTLFAWSVSLPPLEWRPVFDAISRHGLSSYPVARAGAACVSSIAICALSSGQLKEQLCEAGAWAALSGCREVVERQEVDRVIDLCETISQLAAESTLPALCNCGVLLPLCKALEMALDSSDSKEARSARTILDTLSKVARLLAAQGGEQQCGDVLARAAQCTVDATAPWKPANTPLSVAALEFLKFSCFSVSVATIASNPLCRRNCTQLLQYNSSGHCCEPWLFRPGIAQIIAVLSLVESVAASGHGSLALTGVLGEGIVGAMQGPLMKVLQAPCIVGNSTGVHASAAVQVMRRVLKLGLQTDFATPTPALLSPAAVEGSHPDWNALKQLQEEFVATKPSKTDPVLRSMHLPQQQQSGNPLSEEVSVSAVHQALQEDVALFTARKDSRQIHPSTWSQPPAADFKFDTTMAGANLLRVLRVACLSPTRCKTQLDCELRPDSNSGAHTRHFYFGISTERTQRIRFCINNMRFEEGENNKFRMGARPFLYSSSLESKGIGWIQMDSQAGVVAYQNCLGNNIDPLWSLCFELELEAGVQYCLASQVPYSMRDLRQHLYQHTCSLQTSRVIKCGVLCQSLAGRDVPLVTVSDFELVNSEQHDNKPVVAIHARAEAGSAVSSWAIKGLISAITASTDAARELRRNYIFKICPMLNCDGSEAGNSRCDVVGGDSQTQWAETPWSGWAVNAWRQLLKAHEEQLVMVMDIQDLIGVGGVAMHGCGNDCHREEMVLPTLLADMLPRDFNHSACDFSAGDQQHHGLARVTGWRELKLIHSFSLRVSSYSATRVHYTCSDMERIGAAVVDAMFAWHSTQSTAKQRALAMSKSEAFSNHVEQCKQRLKQHGAEVKHPSAAMQQLRATARILLHSTPSSTRPTTEVVIGKGELTPNAQLPLPQLRPPRSSVLTPPQLAQRRACSRQRGVQQQINVPSEGKMWEIQKDHQHIIDQDSLRHPVNSLVDFEPNVCVHGRALHKCRTCVEQIEQNRMRAASRLSTSPNRSRLATVSEERRGVQRRGVKMSPSSDPGVITGLAAAPAGGFMMSPSRPVKKSSAIVQSSQGSVQKFARRMREQRNFSLGFAPGEMPSEQKAKIETRLLASAKSDRPVMLRQHQSRSGARTSPEGVSRSELNHSMGFGSLAPAPNPVMRGLRKMGESVLENQHKMELKQLAQPQIARPKIESSRFLIYNTERLCSMQTTQF